MSLAHGTEAVIREEMLENEFGSDFLLARDSVRSLFRSI